MVTTNYMVHTCLYHIYKNYKIVMILSFLHKIDLVIGIYQVRCIKNIKCGNNRIVIYNYKYIHRFVITQFLMICPLKLFGHIWYLRNYRTVLFLCSTCWLMSGLCAPGLKFHGGHGGHCLSLVRFCLGALKSQ